MLSALFDRDVQLIVIMVNSEFWILNSPNYFSRSSYQMTGAVARLRMFTVGDVKQLK
jgi:hypothetical protein